MWDLAKGNEFLSGVSVGRLRSLYREEETAKGKLRLLAAIHRKNGDSLDDISGLLEKPRTTVHGWLTRFQERGITAKDSIKQSGRPTVLSKKQMKQLVADLERGPPNNPEGLWSTKDVREVIRKKYKVEFVSQHIWRILVNLGFSLQKPRKKHYKSASPDEIKHFKKKASDRHDTTEEKVLLWAHKMKQASD